MRFLLTVLAFISRVLCFVVLLGPSLSLLLSMLLGLRGVLLWCVRLTYLVCAKLLTELNSTLLDMLCIVLQKVGLQFAFELIVWGCSTNFTFWFGDTRS
jgi:hypothetical protein